MTQSIFDNEYFQTIVKRHGGAALAYFYLRDKPQTPAAQIASDLYIDKSEIQRVIDSLKLYDLI